MANEDIGYGKLTAAGGSGAVMTIVAAVADHYGYTLTPELTAAIQTLLTAVVVWWVPHTLTSPKPEGAPVPGH